MPEMLKTKSDLHLARKAWHLLGVLAIVALYRYLPREKALLLAIVVTFIFVSLDILRHSFAQLNEALFSVFRPLMREHERHRPAGTSYLLIGTTLIIFLFSRDVVTLSLLFLAVADPLASLVGLKFGKDKIVGQKSLQGTVAGFFACMLIAASYFFINNLMTERILIVSLLAGLIGAASELLPIWKLDDNFTFPVMSSGLLWMLFLVFGGA